MYGKYTCTVQVQDVHAKWELIPFKNISHSTYSRSICSIRGRYGRGCLRRRCWSRFLSRTQRFAEQGWMRQLVNWLSRGVRAVGKLWRSFLALGLLQRAIVVAFVLLVQSCRLARSNFSGLDRRRRRSRRLLQKHKNTITCTCWENTFTGSDVVQDTVRARKCTHVRSRQVECPSFSWIRNLCWSIGAIVFCTHWRGLFSLDLVLHWARASDVWLR